MKDFDFVGNYCDPASDDQIDKAIKANEEDEVSIVSFVADEILNDDEDDSRHLLEAYKNATKHEKVIIDGILICLTGWSLSTLLERMGFEREENKT